MSASDFAEQLDDFLIENSTYETYEVVPAGEEGGECNISSNRLIVFNNSNDSLKNDCNAVSKLEGYNGIHIFQYGTNADTEYAYNFFASDPNIEFVEYDDVQLIENLVPANDKSEPSSESESDSSLSYGASIVKSAEAVSMTKAATLTEVTVTVAVLDSGVDEEHSFFKTSSGENRILPSDRFKDNHPSPLIDKYYHGTHVAGIIVDNTPENVKIRSYNYFYYQKNTDETVFSTLSLYETIELAVSNNADVINMSISGKGNSFTVQKAVNNAISKGTIVVSSAGNYNKDASGYYPGNIESLITVTATDSSNKPWYSSPSSASNYGSVVDISAPGAMIYSTMPNNSYDSKTGTSMAAPFVSSAAAILKTLNKSLTCSQVCEILQSSATVPPNWDSSKYGAGIVNFENMLSHPLVSVPKPKISLNSSGKYVITGATDADIYYTLDGSEPTVNSFRYDSPITIYGSCDIIKAVAVKGNIKSETLVYKLKTNRKISIYYRSYETLEIPRNSSVRSIFSEDKKIVSISDSEKPEIYGEKKGKTNVTVNLKDGRTIIYNVTVKYSFWQWILRIFFFGFIWMR